MTDSIPFGTTFMSVTATQGTCAGTNAVTCTLGTLANGASATVTIIVVSGATGTITNTAKIAGAVTDPNASNNSASVSTTVMSACSYSILPLEQTFSPSGGSGTIALAASDSSCAWTATAKAAWVTITAGGSGSGNGTVAFSVAANTGGTRTTSISVAGLTFTVVQGGKSTPIQFAAPVNYPLMGSPTAVVVADFNHDGKLDVAASITTATGSLIEVLLSTGNGTFGPPATYSIAGGASQLLAADVNADGLPDLLALVGGSFAVFLNNGSGTLAPPVYYVAGGHNIAVGDFYRDGRVHVATGVGSGIYIYQNLGNGEFVQAETVSIPSGAYWVDVADLNGDSYPDLVTVGNGNYSTVLNNGNGTFATPVTTTFNADFISAADVNGDGLPDLILSTSNATSVSVLLNQGGATFAGAITESLGSAALSGPTIIADVDGDGAPDLEIPAGQDVAILRNIGNGFFDPPTFVNGAALGYNPTPFAIADMNSDGRLDVAVPDTATGGNSFLIFISQTSQACRYVVKPTNIAVMSSGTTGTLTITAAGSCTWTASSNEPWITITGSATGTGNGTVNYAVAKNADTARVGAISVADQTVTFTQAGSLPTLQFGLPSSISLGSAVYSVVEGDFNRDGKQDLAVSVLGSGYGQLEVLLGNGDGTFAAPVSYSGVLATQLIAADFNADGYIDLLALVNGGFEVLLNNRDGTFAAPVVYDFGGGYASKLAIGDLYGDGRVHVAAALGNVVYVYQNLGNGEFVQTVQIVGVGGWVAVADLNGDGYPDIVTADTTSYSIVLNNKNGTFAAPVKTSFSAGYVMAGDVNGDGLPDLILSTVQIAGVSVALNQGNATFAAPVPYPEPYPVGGGGSVVADVDGDGRPDLLVVTETGIAVMRNLGLGAFDQESFLGTGGAAYNYSIAPIDLKGDGHLSVVAPDAVGGGNTLLLFTNTTPQVCGYVVRPGAVLPSAAGVRGHVDCEGCQQVLVDSGIQRTLDHDHGRRYGQRQWHRWLFSGKKRFHRAGRCDDDWRQDGTIYAIYGRRANPYHRIRPWRSGIGRHWLRQRRLQSGRAPRLRCLHS